MIETLSCYSPLRALVKALAKKWDQRRKAGELFKLPYAVMQMSSLFYFSYSTILPSQFSVRVRAISFPTAVSESGVSSISNFFGDTYF
jgi:hypothetical protein